jgi:vacuolar protein sorting-associated protein 18
LKESKEAVYKMFSSHGNIGDLVYFAEVMKDYPQIIMHYLQEENYRKALEALSKQVFINKKKLKLKKFQKFYFI